MPNQMPVPAIPCPLCRGVDLVLQADGRLECAMHHGQFQLAEKPGDGVYIEVVLRHLTTGIEFAFGSFTPADWAAYRREAGLAAA